MKSAYWALLFALFLSFPFNELTAQSNAPKRFKLPKLLPEVSGLYLQSPDQLWWHNDGGHPATLYLTNARGQVLDAIPLPQTINRDWEDLTCDQQGRIYIGDFGNNANNRKDLRIYRYDPKAQLLDSILFAYPDQKAFPPKARDQNFDMEAFFWHADTLHLFSKNTYKRGNYYTKHYVLPADAGTQKLLLRDSLYLKNGLVTAAAMSPDGQSIALLAYKFGRFLGFIPYMKSRIFYLRAFPGSHFTKGEVYRQKVCNFFIPKQYEALDYIDDQTIWIATEKIFFLRPAARQIKVKKGCRQRK